MHTKTSLLLTVAACALVVGCRTTLEGSYWIPEFSSTQSTGGDPALDIDSQLGVVTDESALVYDLVGDAGRNRLRVDYWKIHGDGDTTVAADFLFQGNLYVVSEHVVTTMDLESVGILWEPALIKTDGFRLRIAAGLDMLRFVMDVENITTPAYSGTVEVPGPDSPLASIGLDYMPVPKVGLSFEADMTPWVRLHARAQIFDASYLNLDDRFSGTFTTAVAGIYIGKHRGIRGFLGYRYFNADYDFDGDAGNSTLTGVVGSASLRF